MEDNGQKAFDKKNRLQGVVFGDVFSRFYHQLSNQGAVVLKDVPLFKKEAAGSVADAVVESMMQRCPWLGEKFANDFFRAMGGSEWYDRFKEEADVKFDVRWVIDAINDMASTAVGLVKDDDILEKEVIMEHPNLLFDGRYEPLFMMPENPPAFIPTLIKPVL